jgi:hypothetical protein
MKAVAVSLMGMATALTNRALSRFQGSEASLASEPDGKERIVCGFIPIRVVLAWSRIRSRRRSIVRMIALTVGEDTPIQP